MNRVQQGYLRLLVFVAVCSSGAGGLAGPLATDPDAYTNGVGETFHGSSPLITLTSFPDPAAPAGYLDWAVYEYGHRPAGYVGLEPHPGEFLYAFQFYSTGPAPVDLIYINDSSTANGRAFDPFVGVFTSDAVGGKSGSVIYDLPIAWEFSDPVLPGESTIGLVYSSFGWPIRNYVGGGLVFNGSSVSFVQDLPWVEPEPSTLVLAALGLVGLAAWGRRPKR